MNAPMKTQSPPALPDWLTVVPQQSEPGFLAFLESLAPEGEKVLFGKAVTMQDGSDGYVPTDTLPPNTALYANTGSFIKARAEQNGSLRAKAENIESCLFLMLDDIGTKAKMPTVEPTWKIETSPGNYQWGYAYAERPTKAEQSAAVKAFAAAGYSDPGANNPVRWARIPGSLNKKKQFVAKLTEFHPERRFLLPELCAAMGVDPEPAQPESHAEGQQPAPPVEQVVEMLRHIDASERKVYLDVGMAMKVAYGDAGRAPWVTWAKTCPEYDNPDAERDAAKDWKSFKDMPDGIGIGTLFHYALSGGWKRPAPDVTGMFGAVEGAQQSQAGVPLREWGGVPWEEPHDIRAAMQQLAPDYEMGLLPEVYERMMMAQVDYWPNANTGYYAGAFGGAVAHHVPSHVAVEMRAGSSEFTTLANYTGLIGNTGTAKDKTMNAALGMSEGGALLKWNADVFKRYPMPNDKKGKQSFTPKILHRKFSVEAMRAQIDINHNVGRVPADIVTPEMYDALEGGSAHNQSAFESINSFYCARWDGGYDSSMSFSHGSSHSDGGVLNMMFCTVPNGLANWKFLPDAMRSGLISRLDLFANTQPVPNWLKADKLDVVPVRQWTTVQAKLHDLTPLKLYLEPCDVQEEVDASVKMGNRLTSQGAAHAGWLNKLQVKWARLSAQMTLVEMVRNPEGYPMAQDGFVKRATVPAGIQRMAWNYLSKFAWPHQCFVHNEMLAGEEMKEALMHYARQIFLKRRMRYQRDELVGSKALLTRVRNWPESMSDKLVQLMIGYDWISPLLSTHKVFRLDRPQQAGAFEVNPKFFEVFGKYAEEMTTEKDVLMGSIDGRIKPGKK